MWPCAYSARLVFRPHGVAVSSPPFHGGSTGSNPVGVALLIFKSLREFSSEKRQTKNVAKNPFALVFGVHAVAFVGA